MTIAKDIIARMCIEQYTVAERYFSRRNTVCRIEAKMADGSELTFVYKAYSCGNIVKEAAVLAHLKGDRVPKVLLRGKDALCLEHMRGITMQVALEDMEQRGVSPMGVIHRLVGFMAHFYKAVPGYIYGDVNLRNFIDTDEGVCGVDLEEIVKGVPHTDIGRAAAFLLTYRPEHTAYKQDAAAALMRIGAQKLGLSTAAVEAAMHDELAAMKTRRGTHKR